MGTSGASVSSLIIGLLDLQQHLLRRAAMRLSHKLVRGFLHTVSCNRVFSKITEGRGRLYGLFPVVAEK